MDSSWGRRGRLGAAMPWGSWCAVRRYIGATVGRWTFVFRETIYDKSPIYHQERASKMGATDFPKNVMYAGSEIPDNRPIVSNFPPPEKIHRLTLSRWSDFFRASARENAIPFGADARGPSYFGFRRYPDILQNPDNLCKCFLCSRR